MKTLLALGLLLLPFVVSALALEPDRFELHAVADAASAHTREYFTVADVDAPAQAFLLDKKILLDGTAVQSLTLVPAHAGTALYLNIEFTLEGKQRFAELTTQSLHKRLGIVVDGQLIMATVVQTIIYGGHINAGRDPHEFPYPNFWLPFLHPETPSPSPASPKSDGP